MPPDSTDHAPGPHCPCLHEVERLRKAYDTEVRAEKREVERLKKENQELQDSVQYWMDEIEKLSAAQTA